MKTCTKCNKSKKLELFHKSSRSKDGYKSACIECKNKANKKYYNKTIEYQRLRKRRDIDIKSPKKIELEKKQELLNVGKKQCIKCSEIKALKFYHKNKAQFGGHNNVCKDCRNSNLRNKYNKDDNYSEKQIKKSNNYYKNNSKECIQKSIEYKRNKEKTDELYRLKKRLKRRVYDIMRQNNWTYNDKKDKYIGCSYRELKKYIEKQFEPGMTWDNNTTHGWHIDHTIPMSLAENEEEAARLNYYTNLKPMWAKDNLSKGNRIQIDKRIKKLDKYELLPNETDKQKFIDNKKQERNKIFARKCVIKEVNLKDERQFLNNSHFSGYAISSICLGLFIKDELVMVMSFNKPRFTKEYEWEIIRMASKFNTVVVGGASKLFKYFIKNYNPNSIISYCNLRYGDGDVYNIIGMRKIEKTKPNYWYVKGDVVYPRYKCMKHKLNKLLPIYLNKLSEFDNMMINGYIKYEDLGNNVYVWKKN